MSTPISRSESANDINTGQLNHSLYQATNARSSKDSLFHGRSTRELPEAINMSTFRVEDETLDPDHAVINDRSFASRKEHASSLSCLTSNQSKMADDQSDVRQNRLTAPLPGPSSSSRQEIRDAYIINMHTFRQKNDSLRRECAEPACLKHHNWWERNKRWNSTFILSTLATATAVAASLISDLTHDDDQALFQRSGSVIVCWAMLVTFITLRKRSEKLPSHELMIEAPSLRLSREEDVRLKDLYEQIGNTRITKRKVKRTASECDWVILLASIIGTLIWGYGDLLVN